MSPGQEEGPWFPAAMWGWVLLDPLPWLGPSLQEKKKKEEEGKREKPKIMK